MDEYETEFDWFDEPPTDQTDTGRVDSRWRPPSVPRGRPARDVKPRPRLLALIGFAILAVVAIVVGITSCGGPSERSRESAYLRQVSLVVAGSARAGSTLARTLTSTTMPAATIVAGLNTLADQVQRDLTTIEALHAPARLADIQLQAVTALTLRRLGLHNLAITGSAISSKQQSDGLAGLQRAATYLVAADVIWQDRVETPAAKSSGNAVTAGGLASRLLSSGDLVDTPSLTRLERRLRGLPPVASAQTGGQLQLGSAPLKLGDRGAAVAQLQDLLNAWLRVARPGQPLLTPDGVFGATTATVTRDFQTSHQLPPDGVVGPATRSALQPAAATAATPGSG